MSNTTPKWQLPYPSLPDPADVPSDMQALATRLDNILGSQAPSPVVNGQWLKGQGGAIVWAPIVVGDLPIVPFGRLGRGGSAFAVPGNAFTMVAFDSPLTSTGYAGMATTPSTLATAGPGIYLIWYSVNLDTAGGGTIRQAFVQAPRLGTGRLAPSSARAPDSNGINLHAASIYPLQAGDTLTLTIYSDGTGTDTVNPGGDSPAFGLTFVGRTA